MLWLWLMPRRIMLYLRRVRAGVAVGHQRTTSRQLEAFHDERTRQLAAFIISIPPSLAATKHQPWRA